MAISQLVNSPNQNAMAANRANQSTATITPSTGGQVGTVSPAATHNAMANFNNVNFSSGFNNAGLSDPNVLGALVSLLTALLQQVQSGGGSGGQSMGGGAGGQTANGDEGCCG